MIGKKGRILFVGQSYYHGWFLSRELRKHGWVVDLLNFDSTEDSKSFYLGEDIKFRFSTRAEKLQNLVFYFNALAWYDIFHFNNFYGLYLIDEFDVPDIQRKPETFRFRFLKGCTLFILNNVCKWRDTRIRRVAFFIGIKRIMKLLSENRQFLPERWDIWLLKKMGKVIVYGNNGCHDGVLQSTFRKWSTPDHIPVCDICPWRDAPEVCSDERNRKWGKLRNALADYQLAAGGNRADFNDDPRVHDLPWWGCLDKKMWNPELLIPSNYLLPFPDDIVKIYHSVGNFEARSQAGNKTIKSTHIYFPLIEELKQEGYKVEMIFFNDVPINKIKYYQLQADVVVVMLTYGYFGANVREALMLGKPCICYLRPEWLEQMKVFVPEYVAELPIISATPENIKEVLIDLIDHPEKRKEIGRKSREFAVKWHSTEVAALKMQEIYEKLMDKIPG
jgi:glycosyltransferase involved in cell wall biosynthesis